MLDRVERQVRRVVARHLGVSPHALAPEVSLHDGLAGDRDAVHAIVLAVERRLGVRMDARVLDEVRSYGELVAATIEAIRVRRAQLRHESAAVPTGRVRIRGGQGLTVERAGELTPYMLESICDDARRAGPGTTLEVCVTDATSDDDIDRLRERLASLDRRGVAVRIGRRADAPRTAQKGT